jgi:hypothetical protein
MATSRNRGVKKPKLRDLSLAILTHEETRALRAAIPKADPIAAAILGTALVEHELDVLLRRRIPRNDNDTWEELVGENGPLGTFSAKIKMGYAFRLYDETTKHNLNILRTIRNGFAHARQIVNFNHVLVASELKKVKVLPNGTKLDQKMISHIISATSDFQGSFFLLCIHLSFALVHRRLRWNMDQAARAKRKTMTLRQKMEEANRALSQSPFSGYMAQYLGLGADFPRPPEGKPVNWLRWYQDHRTDGPKKSVPKEGVPTSAHPHDGEPDNGDNK